LAYSSAVLNLGCGRKHLPGAVNLDCTARSKPDVVHDLDLRPWPFSDNQFDKVYAFDVVEHLTDTVAAMEEIHRICRDGASIEITVALRAFTPPRRHDGHEGSRMATRVSLKSPAAAGLEEVRA
jgi:predicted SAM-dependent methyltransferase